VFNIQKAVSRLNFAPKLNEIEITDIKPRWKKWSTHDAFIPAKVCFRWKRVREDRRRFLTPSARRHRVIGVAGVTGLVARHKVILEMSGRDETPVVHAKAFAVIYEKRL
jgi:hypothetical protein